MTGLAGRPRWRGGNLGPGLVAVALVVAVVIGTRWAGTAGGQPAPSASAPVATPPAGPSSTPGQSQAGAAAFPVRPVVVRTEPIDVLGPTPSMSFPLGDLLSVSPDGRYALVWTQLASANQVELTAVPLMGGDPIRLGIAGYEPRGPDDAVDRLALPAWSADSRSIAFENGSRGTIASLVGDPPIPFTARADAPITSVTGGGFIVQTPTGASVVAGTGSPAVSIPRDARGGIYFGDGVALVWFTDRGEVVWTDGTTRTTLAANSDLDAPTPSWSLLARTAQFLVIAVEGRRLDYGALVVSSNGTARVVELPDACSDPDISEDGEFVAYTVCDNTGTAEGYKLRLVRLDDGTAVDVGQAVVSPKFVPGTYRLAWLALSGNPPISPVYTVSVATNEVLP